MLEPVSKSDLPSDSPLPEGWDDWWRQHSARLLLFARSQSRSAADAQDVLQDALVKIWRGRPDGSCPPLSHVFRAIRQCAIDLGRSIERRRKREDQAVADERPIEGVWFQTEPSSAIEADELESSLRKLNSDQREVIVLKIWGDQTFLEIADALSISPNTAASRYRYGLAELRRRLGYKKELSQ